MEVLESVPLAEKRQRKQKWSTDPQNKFWLNDGSKFGSRMLKKMGWSEGKGLGASEQGSADFVRLRANGDSRGLGSSKKPDDTWIEHEADFDAILKRLNESNSNQQPTDDQSCSAASETESRSSLETASKTSRSRIHYHKFTRGKDLSNCSETDMAGILGPRKRRLKRKSGHSDQPTTSEEDSSGHKTTISTMSMGEYFKSKMAAKQEAASSSQNH